MYQAIAIMVVSAALAGSPDAEEADEPEVRDSPGYTLDDEWDEAWLRIFDRSGRPDPDGPMLQRFEGGLYRRYHFDIAVPDFPMSTEQQWALQRTGARMWVQSLSEFDLANRVQMRTELPTWEDGYIRLQYDRRQDLTTDRDVLRFDIGHRDIGDTGVDAALRFLPTWDKEDVDVQAIARYGVDGVGRARLKIGALDTFINASYGLIEARGRVVEEHIRQQNLPLAISADLRSATFAGVRGELYGGVVVPQTRRHRFPDDEARDHLRHRRGILGAGLVEWRIPYTSTAVGLAMSVVDAHMEWEYLEATGQDRSVRETTLSSRIYALGEVTDDLEIQFSMEQIGRPAVWSGPGVDDSERSDREYLNSMRIRWMPTKIVGADLTYLHMQRDTSGAPELPIDGSFHRLVTRVMLQLGDNVWTSFGTGWTLDPMTAVYDGSGMTLIYMP